MFVNTISMKNLFLFLEFELKFWSFIKKGENHSKEMVKQS